MLKRHFPLLITILVFIAGYLFCLSQFLGFASTRVFFDLLTDNAFLGIVAVGMTFVILSGGIDLSVEPVIVFTGVLLAKLIGTYGIDPFFAFAIARVMGTLFGVLIQGLIQTYITVDGTLSSWINHNRRFQQLTNHRLLIAVL
nr:MULTISPECIES: hypothetical protein [Pectobacterium]